MRLGLNMGIFPTKLLEKYKSLGLSDNDLLNVLAFFCTDVTWEQAAKIRGYTSVSRMQTAMQHLFDKGLLVNTKGQIDFMPLLAACDATMETKTGFFELKPKATPKHPKYYDAYQSIKAIVAENMHAWAAFFEEMVAAEFTIQDVIGCAQYIHSYHEALHYDKPVTPVYISSVRLNLGKWIDKGKPESYAKNDFNSEEVMRLVNAS